LKKNTHRETTITKKSGGRVSFNQLYREMTKKGGRSVTERRKNLLLDNTTALLFSFNRSGLCCVSFEEL